MEINRRSLLASLAALPGLGFVLRLRSEATTKSRPLPPTLSDFTFKGRRHVARFSFVSTQPVRPGQVIHLRMTELDIDHNFRVLRADPCDQPLSIGGGIGYSVSAEVIA